MNTLYGMDDISVEYFHRIRYVDMRGHNFSVLDAGQFDNFMKRNVGIDVRKQISADCVTVEGVFRNPTLVVSFILLVKAFFNQ